MVMFYEGCITLRDSYSLKFENAINTNNDKEFIKLMEVFDKISSDRKNEALELYDFIVKLILEKKRVNLLKELKEKIPEYLPRVFKYIEKPNFFNFSLKNIIKDIVLISRFSPNGTTILANYIKNENFNEKYFEELNILVSTKNKTDYHKEISNLMYSCIDKNISIEKIFKILEKEDNKLNIKEILEYLKGNKKTPLMYAMEKNDFNNFEYIYSLHNPFEIINNRAVNDGNLFHFLFDISYKDNHPKMLELMINRNSDQLLNVNMHGQNCLFYVFKNTQSSENSHVYSLFNMVLDTNLIDINHQDRIENTLLHLAFLNKNYTIVQKLLDKGADYQLKNRNNFTPFALALTEKNFYDNNYLLYSNNPKFRDKKEFKYNLIKKMFNLYNVSNNELIKAFSLVIRQYDHNEPTKKCFYSIIEVLKERDCKFELNEMVTNDFWNILAALKSNEEFTNNTGRWFLNQAIKNKFPLDKERNKTFIVLFSEYEKEELNKIMKEKNLDISVKSKKRL